MAAPEWLTEAASRVLGDDVPDVTASTLADGTSLVHVEFPAAIRAVVMDQELASVEDLSVLVTHTSAETRGEIDATLVLGGDGGVRLALVGVASDTTTVAEAPVWSVELRADATESLRVGELLGKLIPLPDFLLGFEVGGAGIVVELQRMGDHRFTRVQLHARLGGEGDLVIIPGVLTIRAPRIVVCHESGRTWIDLLERADFIGLTWDVQVQFPAGVGSARAEVSADTTLATMAEHFGLHDPTGLLAGLQLSAVSANFDHHLGAMVVEVAVTSSWKVGPVELTGLAFRLAHSPAGVAARAVAEWAIAQVKFKVALEHPGPGLGWQLDASMAAERGHGLTLAALMEAFGCSVAGLPSVSLDGVDFSHSTLLGATTVRVSGTWDGCPAELTVSRAHAGVDGSAWSVSGQVIKSGAVLGFTVSNGVTVLAYVGGGGGLSVSGLLAEVGVPGAPDLRIRSALAAKGTGAALVAAELEVTIDHGTLASVPVLGERLPADLSVGISVHALYGKHVATDLLDAVQQAAPAGAPTLPSSVPNGFGGSRVDLRVGTRSFPLGGVTPELSAPGVEGASTATDSSAPAPAPVAVHQNLGGVFDLQSVRPAMTGSAIELTIDGGVRFGPVTMDLMGFVVGYDLKKRAPTVPSLAGLSLLLDRPPVRVQGGFLHTGEDFVGKAEITTSRFSLTALGGFALVQGSPSLFVYGVLRMPLGGPPFFFVEGIAAGFGLNRHLRLPTIDDVETFPLVQAAQGDAPINLEALHDFVSPKVGSAFFAVGVKFTSFKLVHGFLLAIVGMDTTTGDFEVAVVGTGEWISPPEAPVGARIAHVQLDILAKLSSRDASLLVQAKLGPDCFVISPQCHISGGMALATWYGGPHAGDFVLSIGGYHPKFEVPAHYPVPGRLTLDYKISDGLHAGGSVYFALTPTHLMFGFAFNATWSTGPVRAWFDLSLDFLMKFKPLHYDATGHLEIGASVDLWLCTISVSAGADLHIWGPDLGGHACVHLGPFHGGLDFGAPVAPPAALTAEEFRTTFLPKQASDVITIRPAGGLRSTVKTKGPDGKQVIERWNFNPKEMAIEIDSLVPLDEEVGVPPMTAADAPDHVKVRLTHDVALARMEDGAWASVALPEFDPLHKRFPPALWKAGNAVDPTGTLPAGIRLRGGAHPLERNGAPVYSRAELSADGGAKVYLAPEPSIPKDAAVAARSAPDRAADFEVYDAALRSADAAAKARQQARDRLLGGLARLLGDDALTPTRYGGRTSVEPLLDPPLHTGRGA